MLTVRKKGQSLWQSFYMQILFVVIMLMCQKRNLAALLAYCLLLPLLLESLADEKVQKSDF